MPVKSMADTDFGLPAVLEEFTGTITPPEVQMGSPLDNPSVITVSKLGKT